MNLSEYSTEELKAEIEAREEAISTQPQLIPIDKRNMIGVENIAKNIVESVVKGTWHEDNDDKHYMYEEVMVALYGKDFFNWFSKHAYN